MWEYLLVKRCSGKYDLEGKQGIPEWWGGLFSEDRTSWVPAGHSPDLPHHGESVQQRDKFSLKQPKSPILWCSLPGKACAAAQISVLLFS